MAEYILAFAAGFAFGAAALAFVLWIIHDDHNDDPPESDPIYAARGLDAYPRLVRRPVAMSK
jgi:hypothetical protein